jgi:hypothetical protein
VEEASFLSREGREVNRDYLQTLQDGSFRFLEHLHYHIADECRKPIQVAERLDCADSLALFIRAKAALKPPQSKRFASCYLTGENA